MIADYGKPCATCRTALVIGSSAAYCPSCEPAFHQLEVRFDRTGVVATSDEIMAAMITDDGLAAAAAIATG